MIVIGPFHCSTYHPERPSSCCNICQGPKEAEAPRPNSINAAVPKAMSRDEELSFTIAIERVSFCRLVMGGRNRKANERTKYI